VIGVNATRAALGAASARPAPTRPRRRARAGELLLADLLEREARAPLGRIAVVVRLSRLPPPGARPYHRRIARALLEDCAQRHGGQVVALGTGDLVLLTVPPAGDPAGGPLTLPPLLARLLRSEDDTPEPIADAITLADGRDRISALLDAAAAADDTPDDDAGHDDPAPVAATNISRMTTTRPRNIFARQPAAMPDPPADAATRLLAAGIAPLLQFQTAVRLPPRPACADAAPRDAAPAIPIRPVHRALRISPALLAARLASQDPTTAVATPGAPPLADPWLRQHLASRLAAALLAQLHTAWGTGSPLDPTPRRGMPPLLLTLPPALVNGADFAAFAARFPATDTASAPRIAISMAEASADPAGFAAARARLRAAGMPLVLDGLSHHALLLARPEALEPDLLALPWSSALPRLPEARLAEIAAAVQRIGPATIVLTGADSEAALRWGRAAGIQMFQGSHAEAMLAATRLMQCPGAAACPLRVCAERATATSPAGRAGCTNHRLLEQGVPDPVHAVA
jgi:hypothetical protein